MALLQILKNPKSSVSEAYRTLRTNVQFAQGDKQLKTIVITSTGAGEGKSTTTSNMAAALAQSGQKVLIMDCDLRKPTIHKIFSLPNDKGLTNMLVANVTYGEAIKTTDIENLHVLPSGTIPPNPSELLNSKRMAALVDKLKETYDYIIMDTPPIAVVTDAQILAGKYDGTILVVASGQADKKGAVAAKGLLDKVGANLIGVVLNKMAQQSMMYGKYKQYYNYGYYVSK